MEREKPAVREISFSASEKGRLKRHRKRREENRTRIFWRKDEEKDPKSLLGGTEGPPTPVFFRWTCDKEDILLQGIR
jgi:hypothetical protein